MKQIFILSAARTNGKRAAILMSEKASFPLAERLRRGEVTLGEVFSFLSGLYFRGKHAFAERFAAPPEGVYGSYVITSNAGLVPAETLIDLDRLKSFSEVDFHTNETRYTKPLAASSREIAALALDECRVILLGSIATGKYVDVLLQHFATKLFYPLEFVGRGDMSRGGLLLRSVSAGSELSYAEIKAGEKLTGKRPPKLDVLSPKLRITKEI